MAEKKNIREITVVLGATLLLTLPFLDQAFHIDDEEFIRFGLMNSEHPFRVFINNHDYASIFFETFRTTHPPILSHYIGFLAVIGGGVSEPLLHTGFLAFPLLAAVSIYSLGRRFTGNALAAALMLVFAPGFVVMSHTLMGDVPGLSLWLAATASYVWGLDKRNTCLMMLAAILASLGVLVSYECLFLVPLWLLYAVIERRIGRSSMIPVLLPLGLFALYAVYVVISSGGPPSLSNKHMGMGLLFSLRNIPAKLVAVLVFIGSTTIFPLTLIFAFIDRKRGLLLVAPGFLLAGMLVLPLIAAGAIDLSYGLLLSVTTIAGATVVTWLIVSLDSFTAWRQGAMAEKETLFLSLWTLGVLFYAVVWMSYASVRYLLPLFAPLALLFVRKVEMKTPGGGWGKAVVYGTSIVLGLAVAVAAGVADFRAADAYRSLAGELRDEYAESGRQVWFLGEFDFRYYMEKEGFTYLGAQSEPRRGDLLIRSAYGLTPVPPEEHLVEIRRDTIEDRFPVRTWSYWAGAGFYSNWMGTLPIVPSRARIDEYTVYEFIDNDWDPASDYRTR